MSTSDDALRNNLGGLRRKVHSDEPLNPADVAAAFGWDKQQLRSREIPANDTILRVGRGYIGIQPAALFATPVRVERGDLISDAALFGYHASVRWGVFADRIGLTVFNSHWLMHDNWFELPTVTWDRVEQERDFLARLEPQKLLKGELDKFALERFPNPHLLQPVDDELVDRLDSWRDEALRSSRDVLNVDQHLQTLFARLFVLRTIEDRGLAPQVPPLSLAVAPSLQLNTDVLSDIFQTARIYIGSDLFDNIDLSNVPYNVICGIIRDLYIPRNLPRTLSRYNFSWIDSDVLGHAYEKYLSTILEPRPIAPQLDLFKESYRDVARISVRRAGGVYYTPPYITRFLAHESIDTYFKKPVHNLAPRVVDFACGSGSFLVAAVDILLEALKRVDPDPKRNWAKYLIEGGYINGVDVDEKAVTVARLDIWNRLTEEPDPLPLPHLTKVIVKGDGLDIATWDQLGREFDIVLGNPPFLATARVLNRAQLEATFVTASGRYDYSSLFVEQAIRVTEPHGVIGMVVPNRLFINHNATSIRALLTNAMNLDVIVNFGSNEVFVGTSAYIGCLVAAHREPLLPPAQTVKVIDVKTLPDNFAAASLLDMDNGLRSGDGASNVYMAQHPRGGVPWVLLSTEEKRLQVQLADQSTRLDEISGIFQGIRTGANDIYILQLLSRDEQYSAEVRNGLGDTSVLEAELLRPVVYGAEVRKYDEVSFDKYILYPYLNGTIVTESVMEVRYPQTYRYLLGYRDILSARTSISASGLRWYELVRKRDEEWLRRPKLLIRDLAPETSFAVDSEGRVFIVGGTAVVPEDDDLLFPILAYLNSRHISRLVARITPQFRGNFQKFEPQHLQQIPVLNRLIEDANFAGRLGELARRATETKGSARDSAIEEIDKIVEDAMKVVDAGAGD